MQSDQPIELDPERFPNLTGRESAFYETWWRTIMRPDDPHTMKWLDYEEGAVARAHERLDEIEQYESLSGARVLEIGCQGGAALIALAERGADAHGVDVDAKSIAASAARAEGYGVSVAPEVGSASELRYESGRFDIVMSFDVIEHVPDKLAMLHEAVRVLRPGGLLVISGPCRFGLKLLLSDPHYGHKGVSVLPGDVARWWLTNYRGEYEYDAVTFPTKAWTEHHLRRLGIKLLASPDGRPAPTGVKSVPSRFLDELRQGFTLVGYKGESPSTTHART